LEPATEFLRFVNANGPGREPEPRRKLIAIGRGRCPRIVDADLILATFTIPLEALSPLVFEIERRLFYFGGGEAHYFVSVFAFDVEDVTGSAHAASNSAAPFTRAALTASVLPP
jgi:hypothetical protein